MAAGYAKYQIIPNWIVLLDQPNFPARFHLFNRFSPLDRVFGIMELLEIDQPSTPYFFVKLSTCFWRSSKHATNQVTGSSNVKCTADAMASM